MDKQSLGISELHSYLSPEPVSCGQSAHVRHKRLQGGVQQVILLHGLERPKVVASVVHLGHCPLPSVVAKDWAQDGNADLLQQLHWVLRSLGQQIWDEKTVPISFQMLHCKKHFVVVLVFHGQFHQLGFSPKALSLHDAFAKARALKHSFLELPP